MNRSRCFNLTIIALLSGCNGALELTLGSYLNCIRFPLSGMVMVGINLIIYTLGYRMVPRRGNVLTMGVITALLNLFLGGSFKIWSILAIFLEALIIELFFCVGGLKAITVSLAGIGVNLFTLVFSFFTISLVMGRGLWGSITALGEKFLGPSGAAAVSIYAVLGMIIIFHVVGGAVSGWLAWRAYLLSLKAVRVTDEGALGQDC